MAKRQVPQKLETGTAYPKMHVAGKRPVVLALMVVAAYVAMGLALSLFVPVHTATFKFIFIALAIVTFQIILGFANIMLGTIERNSKK